MIIPSIKYFFYIALVVFSFFISGCNDDPSLVGEGVMPDKDVIQGLTIPIKGLTARNVVKDAILTDKVGYAILGEFNDPQFGYSKGEFVTQINSGAALKIDRFNLPGYFLDKLELQLVLKYGSGWYGDATAVHHISVYELSEALANDLTNYYSNTSMIGKYYPTPIGNLDFKTNRNSDSIWNVYSGVDTIRITLSDELANRFFTGVDKNLISNNKAFRDWFKGVYITSTTSESVFGSLLQLKAWDYGLGLKLYYHSIIENTTTHKNDTILNRFHLFPITLEGTDFNTFTHTLLPNVDTISPQPENLYCQGMAGSYTHINLPPDEIFNLKDSLATNADGYSQDFSSVTLELFVDSAKSEISKYTPPSSLQLFRYNEKTNKIEVPFMHYRSTTDSSEFVKYTTPVSLASYNKSTMSYKFIIKNDFFKRVVNQDDDILPVSKREGMGKEDDFQDIYIGPANSNQTMNRVVFYGKDNGTKQGVVFKVRMVKYLSKI